MPPLQRAATGRLSRWAYGAIKTLARVFSRLYFRLRIENPPRIEGGYVLVCNHTSFLDPILLGVASPRPVAFLMNAANYRSPLLGWLYRLSRCVPVSPHGGNRQALRTAREALDGGEVLGIFPEGGVSRDGEPLLGNPGAVALVLQKNVAVVPVGLLGARRALPYAAVLPRPASVTVRFGEPIGADELMVGADRKERLSWATARIMREIAALTGQVSREDQILRQQAQVERSPEKKN